MDRKYAVVENNRVTNVIVGVEPSVLAANPGMYIDCTDGWDYESGIDGSTFFPAPVVPEEPVVEPTES
jgi:hypothetical protein